MYDISIFYYENTRSEVKMDFLVFIRLIRLMKPQSFWLKTIWNHWCVFLDYITRFIRWLNYLQLNNSTCLKVFWSHIYMAWLGNPINKE